MSLNVGQEVIGYVDEIMEDAIEDCAIAVEIHVKCEQTMEAIFKRVELLIDMAIWDSIRIATRL